MGANALLAYGLCRVAAVSPALRVADVQYNAASILDIAREAAAAGARLIVTPELSLTGHSCADLFFDTRLRSAAVAALLELARQSAELGAAEAALVVGLPLQIGPRLYNVAAVLRGGRILGIVPKSFLPNYGEFYEARWFSPARLLTEHSVRLGGEEIPVGTDLLFALAEGCTAQPPHASEGGSGGGVRSQPSHTADACGDRSAVGSPIASQQRYFGIEICEDLWAVQPPSGALAAAGALVIVNPSASTEQLGKHAYREALVCQQSARCLAAYLYAGAGAGESSTDVVYSGHCMVAENGVLLAQGERFSFDSRMTLADIDLEALEHERLRNTSFARAGDSDTGFALPLVRHVGAAQDFAQAGSTAQVCGGLRNAQSADSASSENAAQAADTVLRANAAGVEGTAQAENAAQAEGITPAENAAQFAGDFTGLGAAPATLPPSLAPGVLRLLRPNPALPFVPADESRRAVHCEEIFAIQRTALARRLRQLGPRAKVVIGISGGLDSTLALLVCVQAMDVLGLGRERILGITMPGFGTTQRTRSNATDLMAALGIETRTISIEAAARQHFEDIGHDPAVHDIVFENTQARERTQVLMNIANQQEALVVGTGDLSEAALGWCTYGGDHISMYHVNIGVPKTLVRYLVQWCAQTLFDGTAQATLLDIVATPISPELLPPDPRSGEPQNTEAAVGPYELHDFFLYHFVRHGTRPEKILLYALHAFAGKYDEPTISGWLRVFLRRFFTQQFKRSCMPDGPKVGSVALSPRGDWRMPSDASPSLWQTL